MSVRVEINWVGKSDGMTPHQRITHVSGAHTNGPRWKIDQQKAIAGIETGKWDFFVRREGREVRVIVGRSAYGEKYLKTEADGEQPVNLLSLPDCP